MTAVLSLSGALGEQPVLTVTDADGRETSIVLKAGDYRIEALLASVFGRVTVNHDPGDED